MKLKIKESQVQLAILHYLKAIGAVAGKTRTMGVNRKGRYTFDIYTFRGFPDLVFFYKHKIGFIEVKSSTGKQSKEQKDFERYCAEAGVSYILAKSVEDVEIYIKDWWAR